MAGAEGAHHHVVCGEGQSLKAFAPHNVVTYCFLGFGLGVFYYLRPLLFDLIWPLVI